MQEKGVKGLTDKTLQALKTYPWPCNIRVLENVIERGVILAPQDGWLELEHLFANMAAPELASSAISASGSLKVDAAPACPEQIIEAVMSSGLSLEQLEGALLDEAVKRTGGNLAGAARLLVLTRPQLQYRLKRKEED